MKRFLLFLLPCFLHAAVAFDASVTVHGFTVTTLTTGSFTIGAGSNRACAIGLSSGAAISAITASCGGASASAVTGATDTDTIQVQIWVAIAPTSGTQTATASWTGAQTTSLGAITATGVDQTTPMNNGTGNDTAALTQTSSNPLSITSTSGDLTVSLATDGSQDTTITSNQTKKTSDFGCMDIGPGTGTTSHTWTNGVSVTWRVAGANFKQAAGGAAPKAFPTVL